MPKENWIKKVLIIGSGAIKIGEAGEFDYSGSQAIKALKEEGIKVILVNPNVATIQTDKKFVDRAYFVPIAPDFLEKVIEKERPDGILLGFGGQTALSAGVELEERGILKKHKVKVLGTSIETIKRATDRNYFRKTMLKNGIPILKSRKANSIKEAMVVAKKIGYPIMVRPAYVLGGQASGLAHNEKQLIEIVSRGLTHSRIREVLIEEYVGKWKEIEFEILRDHNDNCLIVCSMENFDPMGIHTGDSIVVAPAQTLSEKELKELKVTSFAIVRALGLVGECNIQFAVHQKTGSFRVIEVNSRLSRSSALASKATGYPIAYATAKIAIGYRLAEIRNKTTNRPAASLEPEVDYLVVKMPRWDFQKFKIINRRLGTQMKSIGEVMAIGKTFEEALQKAVRMTDMGRELTEDGDLENDIEKIRDELTNPTNKRIFYLIKALRKGVDIREIYELTGIAPLFLEKIKNIVDFEDGLRSSKLSFETLKKAKSLGFSDKKIGEFFNKTEIEIRNLRKESGIFPVIKQIKTARRWSETANYLYFTYNSGRDDLKFLEKKKIVVLGSGCYRIGSSVEFDWCCVNMAWVLKRKNIDEVIMVNCNPETVSTDFDVNDKLYFEEITLERVLDIVEKENAFWIVVSVGGQIPNNLALKLAKNSVNILGTSAINIDRAEDRTKFSSLLDELKIKQPKWCKVESIERAKLFAKEIGYPVLVRPSYVLSGSAMNIVFREEQLEDYLKEAAKVSREYPVVISRFMANAREVEVDGVSDGKNVFIGAIIEHVENAGIHSGDATMSIPTISLDKTIKNKIRKYTRNIAKKLYIKGPFNIQFLVKNGDVYVIECNLRASRSMPFVSKATGVNLMELAAKAMFGEKIPNKEAPVSTYWVKSPQFSFMRLDDADPITGVEMVSTGEVACFGNNFEKAFLKSTMAAGMKIPERRKAVLISAGNKKKIIGITKKLANNGFKIYATEHTATALRRNGIDCEKLYKLSENKKPNILDFLTQRKFSLVINVPGPDEMNTQVKIDEYRIRRLAVEFGIPVITNFELANALAKSLHND